MPQGLVSILILTWNSREAAVAAVASALEQTHPEVEVIVLDNHSADGTALDLARRFAGRIQVVRAERNTGFAEGCNRLIALARGDFLLLLNPDARLDPDYLERALPAFQDPRVGLVSGLLLREDRRTVDSSGQFLSRSRKVIDRGFGKPADARRDAPGPVLSVCGAAALYRREMVAALGDGTAFFDPDYFAFFEDLEAGWRAWRAGWKAVCVPEARAVHQRSGGAARGWGLAFSRPDDILAHIVLNRWLMILRHDSASSFLRDLPWIAGRDLALFAALALRRPRVLGKLWSLRGSLRRAWGRRAADRRRRGTWGAWSRRVPPRGIWAAPAGGPRP